MWRKLAGLGVTALAVPQRWGGLGASLADVAVACEELGHHALPGPVPESVAAVPVLLATLAQASGPGESRAAGQVLARSPAVAAAVARALEAGTLACAAQLLGAGRALLEASVRQATQRSQFGRPIGSFQAVKHHLADVAIGLEVARPLLDAAAAALDDQAPGDPPRGEPGAGNMMHSSRDVSAAKIACTDAAYRAARVALQVHGAIGYTQEHDLHLWLTKVRALAGAWGSQAEHRARVMAAIAGPAAWT